MTTPNQPNDERQHTNGVTERISPSPIPPRPISRPVTSGEGGQSNENPDQQGEFASKAPDHNPGAEGREQHSEPVEQTSGGQSPYQEGWSQLPQREPQSNIPQREPQSNLYRPGQAPVTGRPAGGLNGGVTNARTTADLAAKAARKEAAMVKSVGIDGPTRSIARPELIKDMPDLSEIRHPLPPQDTPSMPQYHPVSPAAPVAVAAAAAGEPLRATVQVRRIDPWSTLKISLVISVALFFVWMLAVGLLYIVLEGMGVWERLNNTFTDMVSQDSGSVGLIDAGTVFGYAGVIGLINVVLFTALGTVGTFIYNQCCDLVGGIQVTLADPD
ncbi:DUF3566 domain-containing protein [Nocardia sp. NPDC051832]|uniref:DUF3566 domain-containing protein n=1 Tax=Nocardia sp. NPDC051832 TaxID=3155673 RepID=UPI00343828AC